MKAICQPNDYGDCSQCNETCPDGVRKTCPAFLRENPNAGELPQSRGLGTTIRRLLSAIGYTQRRHVAIKRWLNLSPTCQCEQREKLLNLIGARILNWIGKVNPIRRTKNG